MVKVCVFSRICSVSHDVIGKIEGSRIVIKIDTPCEKFRKHFHLEFPLHKLPQSKCDIIQEMERQIKCSFECSKECALDCTEQCLIPPAVLEVCNMEKGLVKINYTKTSFLKSSESITEYRIPEFE